MPPSDSSSSPSGEPSLAAVSLATANSMWVPAELRLPVPPEELRLLSAGEVAIWESEPRRSSTAASRRCLQHAVSAVRQQAMHSMLDVHCSQSRQGLPNASVCAAMRRIKVVQESSMETALAIAVELNCPRGLLTPQTPRIQVLA